MAVANSSGGAMGVAIAIYNSADVIGACLSSLLASQNAQFRVVLIDNASPDESCEIVRNWAAENLDPMQFAEGDLGEIANADRWLTLVHAPRNGGYAYAINRALELLMVNEGIDLFWVLNPDARPLPDAARHYIDAAGDGDFALMGGRTIFADQPDVIQTDGGRISMWTGVCQSVNWGLPVGKATLPKAHEIDFITGANCVASRKFIERVGLMDESYFLYYEEVEWALRRGNLRLRIVPEAVVAHIGGTTIGTGALGRRPSAFANYFNYRNRRRLISTLNPAGLPLVYLLGLAKALQLLLLGGGDEARGLLAGLLGIDPPASVRNHLMQDAHIVAFGRRRR